MRIPSQFSEDSLYRRGRRPSQPAQPYRRLLRMIMGLALVVVVMRQASKPDMYRVFFGVGPTEQEFLEDGGAAMVADPADSAVVPPQVVVDGADRMIAKSLVADLARSDQGLWVVALTRWQRGEAVPEFPSTAESLREKIESMQGIDSEQRSEWLAMLIALSERVAAVDEPVTANLVPNEAEPSPDVSEQTLVAAFLAALDDAANARVVDGSVWRSGDFDAFYRYLDQSPEFSPRGLVATGVLPLLQQPDVFRSQLMRVQGTVARVDRLDAAQNVFGIESYWQIWLRPTDGADRPIVAIVPEVSEEIASYQPDGTDQNGPPAMIAGRFLKRLAYTSAVGADLAPVVIGRLVMSRSVPADSKLEKKESVGGSALLLTVLVAGLVGVSLALIGVWRTTVAGREARRLRTAYREPPVFTDLDLASAESATFAKGVAAEPQAEPTQRASECSSREAGSRDNSSPPPSSDAL